MSEFISAGAAIIVGILSLVGVVITNNHANNKMQQKMEVAQAVTDIKIVTLTEEVKKHNNFAQRLPVVEEQIKVINHRIDDLEKKG